MMKDTLYNFEGIGTSIQLYVLLHKCLPPLPAIQITNEAFMILAPSSYLIFYQAFSEYKNMTILVFISLESKYANINFFNLKS